MVLEKVASTGTVLKVVVPAICSGVAFFSWYKGETARSVPGACRPARPPAPPPRRRRAGFAAHSPLPPLPAGIWGNGRTMNEEWYTAGVSLQGWLG